ncbi:hypothetical protein TNCV_1676411 [Trichonephila clavipes]|nr:hypothetical protein TNCV_1676411 [Trichonephila clavipes]
MTMSSTGYSSSPLHWSRGSSSILAWLKSGHASLEATPSQWKYTPKKSRPVVRRKRAAVLALTSKVTRIRGILQATRASWVVLNVLQRSPLSEPPRDRYRFRMRPQASEDKKNSKIKNLWYYFTELDI